jgi:hypothetical protein
MLKTPSKSRICCQVCFDFFSLKEILFRCSNKTCPAENDPVRAKFLGVAQSIDPQVVTPSATSDIKQGEAICPKCEDSVGTVIHICPRCHCEIPQEVWGAPNMTISIVGAMGAGKTVYLTSTMKHLRENLGDYLGSEAGVQTATIRTDRDIGKQENTLFVECKPLATTKEKVVNAEVRLPFSYKLNSWGYRKGFRPLKKKLKTYLSIFDAAGEDFNDPTDTITLTQIPNSQGIIMFIDPMSFPGIAAALGMQIAIPQKTPTEILDRFYNAYILKTPNLSLGEKIPIPTAFVLGKADMIEPYTAANPQFNNTPAHDKGVDLKAIEDSSEATRTLLEQLGGGALCGTIENRFSNHCFFTVSCGRTFEDGTGVARFQPQPSRIIDPILWMLWSNGRIPATS